MEFREQITIGLVFLVFAYCASLGFWQLVAAWQRLKALSWLPRSLRPRWGYLFGSSLLALACLWFFGTRTEEIFSPGPASSEFLFFLLAGLLLGLLSTIAVSLLADRLWASLRWRAEKQYARKEEISAQWVRGILYLPPFGDSPWPVICMVPEPGRGSESLGAMAGKLAESGFSVLALDMRAIGSNDSWRYPDVLILFPQAIDYLHTRDEIDASRVGLVGVGLGGDLAIRAAAEDRNIRAVVALGPVLMTENAQPGCDLLQAMTYTDAIRWSRRHQRGELVNQVDAREHIPQLDSQPLFIIYGEEDRVVPPLGTGRLSDNAEVKVTPGLGHLELVSDGRVLSWTTGWFRRHL
ncbi:MAG: alpha/beta hydrolase [Anaerolineae bacterium]|nr:alpha/beta hydrolase [Anaerolineae bacterium]NIN93674.1 alpha/beta hydrolase [Anaerolineae bacterium]NIQ76721.1 alpha/beta hydrolase [Anaerolineae bacterium]